MITKKIVNGKELITACTLATCCLTVEQTDTGYLKFSNELNQELICSLDEFKEIVNYLRSIGTLG